MALRNVVKMGDPVLSKKCRVVEKFDEKLSTLIDDMFETMYASNGVGLAAPQVGLLKRVVVMENTDIRTLEKNKVEDINFIVCDVSFISLTKISAKISELLNAGDFMIILIKPQFECGKSEAKKHKGIIKDEKLHKSVVEQVKNDFLIHNINVLEVKKSCIQGGDGNTEFVALCQKMFTK